MFRRTQSFFLLFSAACCLLAAPARAQEAILSSDVSIDETGHDAADAKAQGMKKAERQGLAELLTKLAPEQKDALMNKLTDDIIGAMVKSVEVQDEKITGTRYRATLRVNYNAVAVDALVDKKPGADTAPAITSSAVLVLPIYVEDGKTMLWEPANPWRAAWKQAILEISGGNVLVPYGDSADTAALTADAAQAANFAALQPFFARYGVGEVVIVKAIYQSTVVGGRIVPAGVQVVRRNVGPQQSDTLVLDYRADPQEDKAGLLLRTARDLTQQIDHQREELMSREALSGAAEDRLMLLIPTTTLDSWTKTRASLSKLQTVTKLEVLAISPQQVDVMLHFKGSKPSLAGDIAGLGLRVQQHENYWVVSRE